MLASLLGDQCAQLPGWRRAQIAGVLPRQAPMSASVPGPVRVAGMLLFGLILLILGGPVQAHRLQVFASAEGDQIQGRAYFVGGHPAPGIEIQLLDADGKQVAELSSDDDGRFRAQVPAVGDYRVVAKSGDGHRAEWPIAASELIGVLDDVTLTTSTALAAGISSSVADASNVGESPNGIPATPPSPAESSLQDDEACFPAGEDLDLVLSVAIERGFEQALEQAVGQRLEQAIGQRLEQAVARQVLPLREALAEAQAQASLRDLLGGLGYIAGLAGFALWWTRRRERRHSVKDNSDG
ncbi:hypothetical protein U5801_22255 [Lamprobacter modestohalophilus]|uniref:hypothetical protein n=1 Tax=Lamprobacter modestohalophilus TaxID=1064514 RepID=UPI002ADEEC94|nr:hypothetical protein [Lamprobacter modestohalophilus]MEA1052507.1 hypothetical protein [Lamprobacter modestohalophilus]